MVSDALTVGQRSRFLGVAMVAFAELWERASFYSVVWLLALYAVTPVKDGGLGYTRGEANDMSGDYTLMAFGLPVVFGLLGDRIIGHYRSVVLGAFIIMSGHATLFLGSESAGVLWAGLWLIASGTGMLKPAMPCVVSSFYPDDRLQRDRAFKYYYMMINIGAVFGPAVAGEIQAAFGYRWAFGWAGVGMAVALGVIVLARPLVPASARGSGLSRRDDTTDRGLDPIRSDPARFRANMAVLSVLFLLFMVWSMAYGVFAGSATSELIGNFYVDRMVGDWNVPTTMMGSIEPAVIIVATPILAWILGVLSRRNRYPNPMWQMVLGGLLSCSAVVLLGWVSRSIPVGQDSAPVIALGVFVSIYAVMSIGEIFISPVFMAVITRLAPKRMQASWQGATLLAIGLLGFATSRIGAYSEADGGEHRVTTFVTTGVVCLAVVTVFGLLTPWLIRIVRRHNPPLRDAVGVAHAEHEALTQVDPGQVGVGVMVDPTPDEPGERT